MILVVQEGKWTAVGRATTEQARRWCLWLAHAERAGRATPVGYHQAMGGDWHIDTDEPEWLADWLVEECGFVRSMLGIVRARER